MPISQNKISAGLIKHLPLLLLFVAAGVFILWMISLGQDINWDLLNYHYYNPYALLRNRIGWDLAPAMQQSFHNPLLDLPIFLLIKNIPPLWVGLILTGFQLLNLWLIWQLSRTVLRAAHLKYADWAALILAILGFAGAGNIGELGGTMGDNIISLAILSILLILIRTPEKPNWADNRLKIFGLSFLTGLSVSLKMTAAIFVPGILILLILQNRRHWLKTLMIATLGLGSGFIILQANLMWQLWQNFGNPLFPYFNNLFKSSFTYLNANTDPRLLPHNLWEYLFYPFFFTFRPRLVSEVNWQDIRFFLAHAYIIAAGLFVIGYRYLEKKYEPAEKKFKFPELSPGLSLIVFYVITYLVWAKLFGIYRYIITLEFLAPLIIFFLAWSAWKWGEKSGSAIWRYLSWLPLLSAIASLPILIMFYQPMYWGRIPWQKDSYFGIDKKDFTRYQGATIFLGEGPQAYLVPYFPASSRFIRIYAPNSGEYYDSLNYQELVPAKIYEGDNMYALLDTTGFWTRAEWLAAFTNILRRHGLLVTRNCQEIPDMLNLRPDMQASYYPVHRFLCKIQKLK